MEGTVNVHDEARVEQLLAIARTVLSVPHLAADDELRSHGGTSLSIVRILAMANRTLGLDINPRDVDAALTIRTLARVARTTAPDGVE